MLHFSSLGNLAYYSIFIFILLIKIAFWNHSDNKEYTWKQLPALLPRASNDLWQISKSRDLIHSTTSGGNTRMCPSVTQLLFAWWKYLSHWNIWQEAPCGFMVGLYEHFPLPLSFRGACPTYESKIRQKSPRPERQKKANINSTICPSTLF